ncbi:Protein-tyrosine phosphatase [Cooperia oncophora]
MSDISTQIHCRENIVDRSSEGPLLGTMQAFWAMVIQEKSEYVLMLCNTVECGDKNKCEQYWPHEVGDVMTFGEDNEGKKFLNFSKLKLDYKEAGKDVSKVIQHFQWENWPDRGVPATKFTAINLLHRVRDSTAPVIVHCSAGIGRTGTIVAISYVTEKMQNGEDCVAMSDLLKEIRTQRPFSIQNEFQYLYVHRVLLAYFLEKYRSRFEHILENGGEEKYRQWCADYKQATGCD